MTGTDSHGADCSLRPFPLFAIAEWWDAEVDEFNRAIPSSTEIHSDTESETTQKLGNRVSI